MRPQKIAGQHLPGYRRHVLFVLRRTRRALDRMVRFLDVVSVRYTGGTVYPSGLPPLRDETPSEQCVDLPQNRLFVRVDGEWITFNPADFKHVGQPWSSNAEYNT